MWEGGKGQKDLIHVGIPAAVRGREASAEKPRTRHTSSKSRGHGAKNKFMEIVALGNMAQPHRTVIVAECNKMKRRSCHQS